MKPVLPRQVEGRNETSLESESSLECSRSASCFIKSEAVRQDAAPDGTSPASIYDFLVKDITDSSENEQPSQNSHGSFHAFSRGSYSDSLAHGLENEHNDAQTNDTSLFQHFRDIAARAQSQPAIRTDESLTLDIMQRLYGELRPRDFESGVHLDGHSIPNISAYKLPDGLHHHLQHTLKSSALGDPARATPVDPAMRRAPHNRHRPESSALNYFAPPPPRPKSPHVAESSPLASHPNSATISVGPQRPPGIGHYTQTVLSSYSFKLPVGTAPAGDPSSFTFPQLAMMEVSPDTLYMIHHGPQANPLAVKHALGAFMSTLHQTTSYTLKLIASNDLSLAAAFNELQIAVLHCTFVIQPGLRSTPGVDGTAQPTIGPPREDASKLSPYNATTFYHAIQFRSLISKVTYIPIPEYLFDIQSSSFAHGGRPATEDLTFNEYYTSHNALNSNITINPATENVKHPEFSLFIGQTTYRTTPSVLYYIFNVVCGIEILEVEIMRKQPCAFFYVYLRSDADVKLSIGKLHKRILFDLHGVWFAQNDREAERLQEFVRNERDRMFPVLPLPKQCMVVEKRNNYGMAASNVHHHRPEPYRHAHRPSPQPPYHYHAAGPQVESGYQYPPFAPRQLDALFGQNSQHFYCVPSHQPTSHANHAGVFLPPVPMHRPVGSYPAGSASYPVSDGPSFPPHPHHPAEYAMVGQPSSRLPANPNGHSDSSAEKKGNVTLSMNVIRTVDAQPTSDL
ncbi:nesprin-1-like protein [Perkinsela sp. CCAP 1560/4]|nr:nesprin-1-like protein [Perkinsela sp. CCAP 1560/4]|eukprot:KNH05148.1 nesprin-1-like protein [Perkinsela sp. CCAP 1560/4]